MSIFHDKALKSVAEAAAKVMQQEELKGNQHKIDANKNGKVDAHDFKLLRGKKSMKKEEVEQLDEVVQKGKRFIVQEVMKVNRQRSARATSRICLRNCYAKKNENERNRADADNKDRYAVKNGKQHTDSYTLGSQLQGSPQFGPSTA
jgi:hypothetical protein